MRIFVLGLPHTKTSVEFTTCAYTMKAWNLCRMMRRRGHEVIHLGVEGSNPDCTTNVPIITDEYWKSLYTHPGAGLHQTGMDGKYAPYQDAYAKNCHDALMEYGGDPQTSIICVPWGGAQFRALEGVPQYAIESGIGYHMTQLKNRVFESYAWMHYHYGRENKPQGQGWYDVVIPNAFDPEMFTFSDRENRKDYFLYMGRLNWDKGLPIAIDVTKRIGAKLKIVGPGDPKQWTDGQPHVEYLPPVGVEDRDKLLGGAIATFVPTQYIEPFGGINVEAQMTGCPVITSDWGAFPETVLHGVTGYRCRTMEQFVWAAKNIGNIDPLSCRHWALANYSLERIAPMYEEYMQMVFNLKGQGFYQEFPKRKQLMWMTKSYPAASTAQPAIPKEHEAPEIETAWQSALKWEAAWWGDKPTERWTHEVEKQKTYARLMGLPSDLKMGKKNILDVGCGPTSMLLRAEHGGKSVGVDPLPISKEMKKRYKDHDIRFFNVKGEDLFKDGNGTQTLREFLFDEVWIYNCLQHVDDPATVLANVVSAAKTIRIFEWINMGVCAGHLHNLTEDTFKIFKTPQWTRHIWNTGFLTDFGGTVNNNYIAIHVEKRE